jgi:FixJ family two-component response regulator
VTRSNPCIALVDDDALVRTALGRLLRLAGFEVSTFHSGDAFLASLGARHPDCTILDVHMPGLSGLDVQARLRARRIRIPVVFMTAADDLALEQVAQEAGGAWLLRKPFSDAELLQAIGTALRIKPSDVK